MGIRIHSILGLLPLFDTIWGFGFSIMYHPAMGYLHLWTTPFLKTYVSKSNDGCHSLAAVSLPRGCCSTAWGPNTGWVTIATHTHTHIYIYMYMCVNKQRTTYVLYIYTIYICVCVCVRVCYCYVYSMHIYKYTYVCTPFLLISHLILSSPILWPRIFVNTCTSPVQPWLLGCVWYLDILGGWDCIILYPPKIYLKGLA